MQDTVQKVSALDLLFISLHVHVGKRNCFICNSSTAIKYHFDTKILKYHFCTKCRFLNAMKSFSLFFFASSLSLNQTCNDKIRYTDFQHFRGRVIKQSTLNANFLVYAQCQTWIRNTQLLDAHIHRHCPSSYFNDLKPTFSLQLRYIFHQFTPISVINTY